VHRREFVEAAVAATIVPAMSQPEPLHRATIPATGERIARVGLGTWQTFDVGADRARRARLGETLRVFEASGASVIDTSPMYGSSESVLGDLLAEVRIRDKVFLATKVWTQGEAAGVSQMTDSLRKLRVDRLDLIQIHNLVDWRTHLKTLRAWKERGTTRLVGITHYQASAASEVLAILRAEPVDVLQFNLSLDEPDAAERVLGICAERGVAFIANRPFGGGGSLVRARGRPLPGWAPEYDIHSWAQFLLKWVLAHPEVTCAIPGTGNPQHLADNLGAARGRLPDQAGRVRMQRFWRDL